MIHKKKKLAQPSFFTPPLSKKSLVRNSYNMSSDNDFEEGGFIMEDRPKRSRRNTRTSTRKNISNGPSRSKKAMTRQKVTKQIEDVVDDYNFDEEDQITSEEDNDEDYVDDEVIVTGQRRKGGKQNPVELSDEDDLVIFSGSGNGTVVNLELQKEVHDLTATPEPVEDTGGFLKEEKPKKTRAKRATKAKKDPKPKLTPFERRTNRLYQWHPELADVFPKLEERSAKKVERAEQPKDMAVNLLNFQLEGLSWMIRQEENGEYKGGILADEMGMGKTIQMIALMMHDRTKGPNLVVAPTVALMQWKSEIETHTNNLLKVGLFHGASRPKSVKELLDFDVILTSYAVVESGYRKEKYGFTRKFKKVKEKSILHEKKFYRVILDEAHNIKDRTSSTAKACDNLNCEKRWCLSGTPLQNRIGELYSLIRFLDIAPFCEYFCTQCSCESKEWNFPDYRVCAQCGHAPMSHMNFFNHFMLKNIQKYGLELEGKESFHRIQLLLRQIMIRRTKVERADDLGLPPKIVEIRRDFFNPEEKDLYQSLYTDSKRQFDDYVAEGVVLNNYANIFTLITRMRQLADHPDLVLKRMKLPGKGGVVELPPGVIICQLCDDEAEEPIESKCHHKFCRICISEYIDSFNGDSNKLQCPVCHIGLSIDLEAPAIEMDADAVEKSSIVNRIDMGGTWKSSTKVEALMEELYKSRSDRMTTKSIVFSQFTSMLDLVEWRLKRAGFETVKLQGSMTPTQRASTIKYFLETPSVEVFLVSLKAGGVALNLVEANQVFILDSWWNPALDTGQAADRIHRIGQHRPIRIVKLVIEDSIESRIIELQEKKANMARATLDADEKAASQLTAADMQFLFNN